MKKLLLVLMVGIFALALVIGCGQKEEPKTETPAAEEQMEQATPDSGMVADSTEAVEEPMEEGAGH